MSLKIFIIDDHADFRALLSHHIAAKWVDAKIIDYDPVESGKLPDSFSGAGCDVVLLGNQVDGEESVVWLRRHLRNGSFPPVICLGGGDEQQIVQSIKAGAEDYISKSGLRHRRLVDAIEQALKTRDISANSSLPFIDQRTGDLNLPALRGYELEKRLASGDMSSVYLTKDTKTGRQVALKVLREVPDAGSGNIAFDRFLQEFELIGKISHPNIVRIYDLGIADDHAYIAMEFCSRGSLKRRIKHGMEPDAAIEILMQISSALGAMHEVGIQHRDLKPTNVLFRDDGSLALIDFGLAKVAHMQAELTGAGEIFGTPYYMSPEQGHGDATDERSDIYSLGVLFFEMLTGMKPFDGENAMAVIVQHQQAPVPRLGGDLEKYQDIVDCMLAKRPEDRYSTCLDLLAAVSECHKPWH